MKALKAQLRFRKNLLQQKSTDTKIYSSFTKPSPTNPRKRIDLTVQDLATHVKTLITEALSQPTPTDSVDILVGHRIKAPVVVSLEIY